MYSKKTVYKTLLEISGTGSGSKGYLPEEISLQVLNSEEGGQDRKLSVLTPKNRSSDGLKWQH